MENATDEKFHDWFKAHLIDESKDIAEPIGSTVDSVTYEQCKADGSSASKSLIIEIICALEEDNAS